MSSRLIFWLALLVAFVFAVSACGSVLVRETKTVYYIGPGGQRINPAQVEMAKRAAQQGNWEPLKLVASWVFNPPPLSQVRIKDQPAPISLERRGSRQYIRLGSNPRVREGYSILAAQEKGYLVYPLQEDKLVPKMLGGNNQVVRNKWLPAGTWVIAKLAIDQRGWPVTTPEGLIKVQVVAAKTCANTTEGLFDFIPLWVTTELVRRLVVVLTKVVEVERIYGRPWYELPLWVLGAVGLTVTSLWAAGAFDRGGGTTCCQPRGTKPATPKPTTSSKPPSNPPPYIPPPYVPPPTTCPPGGSPGARPGP
ncbi:MAG: hypothetical protein COU85_01235 [Candidatus Portnoybacteria bacterium CG10_big_fil_rev_8_21_14_0_10_44_7]|uniref:Uncharacterized protein n=1 Tax=Candidatus Portnoybacteria bacterium CG10_big_fil_rev_8_21_14_0_10_44_7 TaxID=1974816 RepID=A0A2M8KIZ8_9BACT|nr:MAG: hypothetical protein COU85_01235 [Candidatus Portnoybacteria bacterium CG10_big_fil_rev_8_21_14_0_10_44_7]